MVRKRGLASFQTTFGMVIAGTTLVTATPPRPGQNQACGRRSGPDQPCKEMTHLGNGQGKQKLSSRRRRPGGRRRRSGATGGCTNPCQVRKSQQDECDVPVPSDEATNFIVIQPHVFGVGKILFDMPAFATGPHHLLQGGSRWGEHEIIALLLRISDTAADKKPMASIILPLVQHRNDGPVEEPGPF